MPKLKVRRDNLHELQDRVMIGAKSIVDNCYN